MPDLCDWLVETESSFRRSRLPSLYSDLALQKNTNREGFQVNVATWCAALATAAMAGKLPGRQHLLIHATDELLNALASPQYGRPSGLGLVLDDAVRAGKMIDAAEFMNSASSIYHPSWSTSPARILRWGLSQVGLGGDSSYEQRGHLRGGHLVLVDAVERLAEEVMASRQALGSSLGDRIMTRRAFAESLATRTTGPISPQEVTLLLIHLSRDKQELSYDANTVKFKPAGTAAPDPIAPEDQTIASLKSVIAETSSQISILETRIASLQAQAGVAVRNGQKPVALSALRSKRLMEQILQRRYASIHQLEEVYAQVEQAVDQVQMVAILRSSTAVLKQLNTQVGGADRVDELVVALRDEMDQVTEVGQVLQEPSHGDNTIDDVEVDAELEALEREEINKIRGERVPVKQTQPPIHGGHLDQSIQDQQDLQSSIQQMGNLHIGDDSHRDRKTQSSPETKAVGTQPDEVVEDPGKIAEIAS